MSDEGLYLDTATNVDFFDKSFTFVLISDRDRRRSAVRWGNDAAMKVRWIDRKSIKFKRRMRCCHTDMVSTSIRSRTAFRLLFAVRRTAAGFFSCRDLVLQSKAAQLGSELELTLRNKGCGLLESTRKLRLCWRLVVEHLLLGTSLSLQHRHIKRCVVWILIN